jgi:hypothetical protein
MKSQSWLPRTAFIALGTCAVLAMAQPAHAKGSPYRSFSSTEKITGEDDPAPKAKAKTTTSTSRSNGVVKIYPDIIKRAMHVIVREDNDGAPIEFFVFDLQGTLVQNSKMKQRDHLKITGLARGKYIYRVFAGDTETASGEFEIR